MYIDDLLLYDSYWTRAGFPIYPYDSLVSLLSVRSLCRFYEICNNFSNFIGGARTYIVLIAYLAMINNST